MDMVAKGWGHLKTSAPNVEIDSFFPHHPQTLQLLSLSPHLTQIFTFSPTSCPWRMNQKASMRGSCRSFTYIACCTLKPGVHRKSFILGFKLIHLNAIYIYMIFTNIIYCVYLDIYSHPKQDTRFPSLSLASLPFGKFMVNSSVPAE